MRSKWLVILAFCLILCVVVVAAPRHRSKAVQSFTTEENYLVDTEGDDFLRLKPSAVHGNGVFTEKDIGKGDVVLLDCFPKKPLGVVLQIGMSNDDFKRYASKFIPYINHCSQAKNVKVETGKNGKINLVALRNIGAGEELFADYDNAHFAFPFISGSKPGYVKC